MSSLPNVNRSKILVLTLFGAALLHHPATAEDNNYDSTSMRQEQMKKGWQFISQQCSIESRKHRKVKVTGVSVFCAQGNDDGDYKTSCQEGEEATALILFEIQGWENHANVFMTAISRVLGQKEILYEKERLCNFESLTYFASDDSSRVGDDQYALYPCPIKNGEYSLYVKFTIAEVSNDADLELVPDLRFKFFDSDFHQIGCVETGDLALLSVSREMERKGRNFFLITVLAFCGFFAFCLIGHRRRRKLEERAVRKKHASVMRRFHYVQSNRSGDLQMISHSNSSISSSVRRSYPVLGDSSSRSQRLIIPEVSGLGKEII